MSFETRLHQQRPLIMGILNVTPDSFSDGGMHLAADAAVRHAKAMVQEGAEIIDFGAESTRPGSRPVTPEEQCARLEPVLNALVGEMSEPERFFGSIDTTSSRVAEFALLRGIVLVNDVSAGMADPAMFDVVSRHGASIALMHMQGDPATMQVSPQYSDVVSEVRDHLLRRAEIAERAGIPRSRILIDPGIGFGKTRAHNIELLRHLEAFSRLGYPVLLGCSRKRFMGSLCDETDPTALLGATVATTSLGVSKGVKVFRVHDVKPNRQAADMSWHLTGND